MLALSRKKNEAIVINNDIEITVLEVKGDQVKIGITAPKEVPIYRKEVYLQIQEANKAAVDAEGMAALKNLLGEAGDKSQGDFYILSVIFCNKRSLSAQVVVKMFESGLC